MSIDTPIDLFELNRQSWNIRTGAHLRGDWYPHEAFRRGVSSLKPIELELLGELKDLSVLHLQCHFGQDTLSLARMGAEVTGVDISDVAIDEARRLADEVDVKATFLCCNVYDLEAHLAGKFDRVFVSYGALCWLPDLERWAKLVAKFLKPGGELCLVEFHPFIWTFDDDLKTVTYDYSSATPIIEDQTCTYASGERLKLRDACWMHGLADVLSAVLSAGLTITSVREYDWSPFDCLPDAVEFEPGKFRVGKLFARVPLIYSLTAANHAAPSGS